MRMLCALVLLFSISGLVGCGGGVSGVDVNGKVSLDGTPIPDGRIFFVSPDAPMGGFEGTIKDGSFSASVPEGTYPVRITALRETGEMQPGPGGPDDPMEPVREDYIPAKYNSQTTLTATIPSDAPLDFTLTN